MTRYRERLVFIVFMFFFSLLLATIFVFPQASFFLEKILLLGLLAFILQLFIKKRERKRKPIVQINRQLARILSLPFFPQVQFPTGNKSTYAPYLAIDYTNQLLQIPIENIVDQSETQIIPFELIRELHLHLPNEPVCSTYFGHGCYWEQSLKDLRARYDLSDKSLALTFILEPMHHFPEQLTLPLTDISIPLNYQEELTVTNMMVALEQVCLSSLKRSKRYILLNKK